MVLGNAVLVRNALNGVHGAGSDIGTCFCRAAGERGPESKRDESPGETEGGSPDARKKTPDVSGVIREGRELCGFLFAVGLFRGSRGYGNGLLAGLRFDGLGPPWSEHGLSFEKHVGLFS